jgi:acetoin utilization deacetylase AcuC-like enzyme
MVEKLNIIKNSNHMLHRPLFELDDMERVPHQEQPQRIINIEKTIRSTNLPVNFIEVNPRGEEILKDIHTQDLIDTIRLISENCSEEEYVMPYVFSSIRRPRRRSKEIKRLNYNCMDMGTPIGKYTYETALTSASIAYQGAGHILNGEKLAYSLCRPPGHHAEKDVYGGYCYFNNAGVAANRFLKEGGERVVILDIDYHHGNGTQDVFYETDSVLYVSIHGHPDYGYPYYSGFEHETGSGKGLGYNINMPLMPETDEKTYLEALDKVLDKIKKYNPSFFIMSLGLDAYKLDPICQFKLDIDSYYIIGKKIREMNLPTLVVQEGGYYVEGLGDIVVSYFKGMLDLG